LIIAGAASQDPCQSDGSNSPLCNPVSPLQPLQFLPPFVDFPNSVENGKSNDSATTWTARIAWDATDSINLYASAGTGFKATSWNLSRDSRPFASDIAALDAAGLTVNNLVPSTRYAGPEDSTVYELGFKGRWGRNYLNVAVFDQEITGFQSNVFTGTGFDLVNAEKQSVKGAEFDTVWVPVDPLSIAFSLTWLDAVYDSFTNSSNGDISGTTPAGIPEWSYVLSGVYDFEFGSTMTGFLRAEYIYESEHQLVENIPEDLISREVSLVNASAGISWDNGFEVMLWGRNLTDDEYLLSAFPTTVQTGSVSAYPNQPRTYGITVTARFD
jgi:outer membrane receptor protein involved in Fe transport